MWKVVATWESSSFFLGGGGSTRNNLIWCIWHLWFQWDKTREIVLQVARFVALFSVANDRDSNTTEKNEKQDWESRWAARNWNNYPYTINSDLIWFCKLPLHTARNRCWIQSWIYCFQEFNLLEGWAERIFTCIKAKNKESIFLNNFASCSEINQSSKITQNGRQSHTRQKIQYIGVGLKYKVNIQ